MSLSTTVVFSYENGFNSLILANYPNSIITNNMTEFLGKVSEKVIGILIIGKDGNISSPALVDLANVHVLALSEIPKPSWVPEEQYHTFDTNTFLTLIRDIVVPFQILGTKD